MTPLISFRDPAGFVVAADQRIVRAVRAEAVPDLLRLLDSPVAARFVAAGQLIGTRRLERDEAARWVASHYPGASSQLDGMFVEHDRVEFPSYPYEWPAEMLHAAGELTLDLATAMLDDGIGLKDATPYNVLFRGPRPVFVDVLSFESRNERVAQWTPYAQFVRTFVLPLLLHAAFGMRTADLLLASRDGVQPEQAYPFFGVLSRLRPLVLKHVAAPRWLSGAASERIYKERQQPSPEKASFILRSLLRGLRRDLETLRPDTARSSVWSDYLPAEREETDEYVQVKRELIGRVLSESAPRRVLDIGTNTGLFARLAAAAGASVVAIDSDPVVVGRLWAASAASKLDILPLCVDFTRPTPAIGWENRENQSFLERARGHRFDVVMMLAVIHHICVTERVPLREVLETVAGLTTDRLIIEFVSASDPMFRRLLRGREELHRDWTEEHFEAALSMRFEVVEKRPLPGGTRTMFIATLRR